MINLYLARNKAGNLKLFIGEPTYSMEFDKWHSDRGYIEDIVDDNQFRGLGYGNSPAIVVLTPTIAGRKESE